MENAIATGVLKARVRRASYLLQLEGPGLVWDRGRFETVLHYLTLHDPTNVDEDDRWLSVRTLVDAFNERRSVPLVV